MNAAIERSIGVSDKTRLTHRPVGGDEFGNRVGGSGEIGQRYLWIRNRILRAGHARTGTAYRGLGVAHVATVAVERWPKSRAGSRDRVHFLEALKGLGEKGLLVAVERGVCPARRRGSRSRAGIALRPGRA